ncbi:Alkaline ceramidase, partial [Cucurbita argyrosperma subsp. sororia]
MILAIGSMFFHATLQKVSFLFPYGVMFAVAHSILRYDIGFKVHYVNLCLLCVPRMYKYYMCTQDTSAKRLAKLYSSTFLLGIFCWVIDRGTARRYQIGSSILKVMPCGMFSWV